MVLALIQTLLSMVTFVCVHKASTVPICQLDCRPCKPNTCWHNGTCIAVSNTTFNCSCASGWKGTQYETQINYCQYGTCLNNGDCRPLFQNYTCECVGTSYSGHHCEIISSKTAVSQTIAKSLAYIAILAMVTCALFILRMDILKYWFGIDVTRVEKDEIKKKKQVKKVKSTKPPILIRFIYVNLPSPALQSQKPVGSITETTV